MCDKHPRRFRRGFVLLLTLVLLALAGVALATAGRKVTRQSLDVLAAQEALQRRWTTLSCERLLLPSAEAALTAAEAEIGRPLTAATRTVTLGGQTVTLVFTDEQAKPNVNTLHERLGRTGVDAATKRVARAARTGSAVAIRPTPPQPTSLTRGDPATTLLPTYAAYEQVFAADHPNELLTLETDGSSAQTPPITCWGDGRINFRRASREALAETLSPIMAPSGIEELLRLRAAFPGLSVDDALRQLGIDEDEHARLAVQLTGRSGCHGLWTVMDDGRRQWYTFAVRESGSGDESRIVRFAW